MREKCARAEEDARGQGEYFSSLLDPKAKRERPALKKGAAHEKPLGHGSDAALQEG